VHNESWRWPTLPNGHLQSIADQLILKNRKNKLYFAFKELGRVVRTMFLLEYIKDLDLRRTIQAATCKSEEFNEFARWLSFANGGKISANLAHDQSKIVKFNHFTGELRGSLQHERDDRGVKPTETGRAQH
jgi:TnpA family transposase